MRISTFGYSMKQGVKNIGRNKMFSIASIATMAACIFLFGLFYAIIVNLNYIVEEAEKNVAITIVSVILGKAEKQEFRFLLIKMENAWEILS